MYHEVNCNYCNCPVSRCECNQRPKLGHIQTTVFPQQPQKFSGGVTHRDAELRKAALDAVVALECWKTSIIGVDAANAYDGFLKAMDALREALAR